MSRRRHGPRTSPANPLPPVDVTVTVERLVPGGVGLARDDGGVVFVSGALPGERIVARIEKKRGGTRHARRLEILEASADRVSPDCAVHPRCGGCDLIDLAAHARPAVKDELVHDVLRRVGRLSEEDRKAVRPTRTPPDPAEGARRRARAHVGEDGTFGFFAPKSHDVVDTERCVALVPALENAWRWARSAGFPRGTSIEFLANAAGEVFLSSTPDVAEILERAVTEEVAAGVCAYGNANHDSLEAFSEAAFFAGERGAEGVISVGAAGGPFGADAATFTQASEFGARAIAEEVVRGAYLPLSQLEGVDDAPWSMASGLSGLAEGVSPGTRVLELFAGAGHLSFPLASVGAHVTAVEGAPVSAAWLAANAEVFAATAQVPGAHVTAVSAYIDPEELADEIRREKDAKVLVADPPRTGIPNAAGLFAAVPAPRLVLVSCDLATGARDLNAAMAAGYRLVRLVPIDAFARTAHLEWVATLVREPPEAETATPPTPDGESLSAIDE